MYLFSDHGVTNIINTIQYKCTCNCTVKAPNHIVLHKKNRNTKSAYQGGTQTILSWGVSC